MNKTLTRRTDPMTALFETALSTWRLAVPTPNASHTRDTATTLYARAARYERTQPGFASDLRAAAEAMDRSANDKRA